MTTKLIDGHWYRSRKALDTPAGLRPTGEPHRAPDGLAVLIYDARGRSRRPTPYPPGTGGGGGETATADRPAALVVQADDGHDLMAVAGRDRLVRVEFAPGDLDDLEPLVEYDHLPEARKDHGVYPDGHKLA